VGRLTDAGGAAPIRRREATTDPPESASIDLRIGWLRRELAETTPVRRAERVRWAIRAEIVRVLGEEIDPPAPLMTPRASRTPAWTRS